MMKRWVGFGLACVAVIALSGCMGRSCGGWWETRHSCGHSCGYSNCGACGHDACCGRHEHCGSCDGGCRQEHCPADEAAPTGAEKTRGERAYESFYLGR